MENAANQPVNQSNNLFLLRRRRRAFRNAQAAEVSSTTGTSVVAVKQKGLIPELLSQINCNN